MKKRSFSFMGIWQEVWDLLNRRHPFLGLLVVVCVLSAFAIISLHHEADSLKELAVPITSNELRASYEKAYLDNQLAAEKNYQGKLFEVTGVVDEIKNDVFGKPMLSFWADGFSIDDTEIHMADSYKEWLLKLHPGNKVKVKARFKKMTLTWVEMEAE